MMWLFNDTVGIFWTQAHIFNTLLRKYILPVENVTDISLADGCHHIF